MKRITILTQYYYPEIGAPQTRLYETVEGLKKLGWHVQIITALPNYPKGKIFDEYYRKYYVKENQGECEIHRYWMYPSISKKALPRILSMLSFSISSLFSFYRVKRFRPNFIFTESPPLTLGLSGIFLSKITRSKHILNVSDIWPLSAYELGALKKGYFYSIIEKLEHFIYRNSNACTGQSQGIVDHLKQNKVHRCFLYRNGINIKKYTKTIPNRKGKLKIVYAGLLGVAQDLYSICQFIKLNNAELHLYGDGAQRNQIEEFLHRTKHPNIFLHESLPSHAIANELIKYDVALVPLAKQIFGAIPSKIYEAMAAGLPIIYSGGGEADQIIINNKLGWICQPSNYSEISETINRISNLSNSELEGFSERCRLSAENIFNRETQIKNLNKFLLEL